DEPCGSPIAVEARGRRHVDRSESPRASERGEALEHRPVTVRRDLQRREPEGVPYEYETSRERLPEVASEPGRSPTLHSAAEPRADRRVLLAPEVVPTEVERHDVGLELEEVALEPFE